MSDTNKQISISKIIENNYRSIIILIYGSVLMCAKDYLDLRTTYYIKTAYLITIFSILALSLLFQNFDIVTEINKLMQKFLNIIQSKIFKSKTTSVKSPNLSAKRMWRGAAAQTMANAKASLPVKLPKTPKFGPYGDGMPSMV